jgi:CelD/BcsL family acetyltransferase involved in cellulose biosynthesis
MAPVTDSRLRADVVPPSALSPSEIELWHRMLVQTPSLQRAFLTPAFALACERATARAHVAVLRAGATIHAFLPFQFKSAWHQRIRLAERIGGNMSDNAGLIACPDFRTDAQSLLRLGGLASLQLSHLMEGQDQFGLDAEWSQISYVTDLNAGPDAYFAALFERDRGLVRDTERCLRKAEKTYGQLCLVQPDNIPSDMLAAVIAEKRLQYRRTQVADPFMNPEHLRLIEALNESGGPECRLVMTRLQAGDRILAQHLGLRHHDVLTYWFPVYDPDAHGVSPGRLLLWYIIRQAINDGIRLIDYGEGEALYKRQFGTGTMRLGRAMWSAGNVRSMVARAWQSAEWRLRERSLRMRKQAVEQN